MGIDISNMNDGSSSKPASSDRGEGGDLASETELVGRKRKNMSSKKPRAAHRMLAMLLPDVHASLCPTIPPELLSHFVDGDYCPTESQQQAKHNFFLRKASLVSLKQEEDRKSLHLFHAGMCVTPSTVMLDTGSDVKIMIGPKLAKDLRLTWTPGTANIVGVGGSGGGDGYAHQRIIIRIGAFDGKNVDTVGPFDGCFAISVIPMVMKEQLVKDIGSEVIIG